jgi:hypothetical protein
VSRSRLPLLVLVADLVAVIVFAAIGRASHGEDGLGGLLVTAAPFLVAALAAWATPWARADPVSVRAGVLTVGVTAVLGLLLRWGFSGHLPPWTFVLVTIGSLALLMLGWRAVAALTRSRVAGRSARR